LDVLQRSCTRPFIIIGRYGQAVILQLINDDGFVKSTILTTKVAKEEEYFTKNKTPLI